MINPPLSLYVHVPWCVQKCPYCDFNSHGLKDTLPEQEYVAHLLSDLEQEADRVAAVDDGSPRSIQTIFIGGGTPSLLSEDAMAKLISGIKSRISVADDAEITMEANPGTIETQRFTGFRQAGINRISIGVQSFQKDKLHSLGRIHDDHQAQRAAGFARAAGLNTFNLDLMHGLPDQSLDDGLYDLNTAIAQRPPHLSWYQLTIEPNTQFHSRPPILPEDETLWDIQDKGHQLLTEAGYQQYEISAYSLPGHQCRHNLNYWRFGDYLGIGCGAHGKLTDAKHGTISRTVKVKHPKGYMDLTREYTDQQWQVEASDLPFEFFMNRLRLVEPCPKDAFGQFTGIALPDETAANIDEAVTKGLLSDNGDSWQVTPMGRRYLNSLLEMMV